LEEHLKNTDAYSRECHEASHESERKEGREQMAVSRTDMIQQDVRFLPG